MQELKKAISCHLSEMATKIQVNSSSLLAWGEVELPEELREELEETQEK